MKSLYEIKPTMVIDKNINNNKFITNDLVLQKLIDTFIEVLEMNIDKNDLNQMYNNLSTLRIENKHTISKILSRIITDYMITGEYYLYENLISILPMVKNNIISKYTRWYYGTYI